MTPAGQQRRGPWSAVIVIAILGVAVVGGYVALFSDDAAEQDAPAIERASGEPRASRASSAWSGGSGDPSGSRDSAHGEDRDLARRAVAHGADSTTGAYGDARPGTPSSAPAILDAGGRGVMVSRVSPPAPAPIARPTEPPPPEVRLRASRALERITEQRIAELTQHLEQARRDGSERRIAHLERVIARIRAQQPRIREHVEATQREAEAAGGARESEAAPAEAPSAP